MHSRVGTEQKEKLRDWEIGYRETCHTEQGFMKLALSEAMLNICRYSPTLWKFTLCHSTFTKHLHQYLFSLTKRNLKRIFTFTKKAESENSVQRLFCREPSQRQLATRALPSFCCRNYTQHPSIKLPQLWNVTVNNCAFYLDLFCASVSSKMRPKVIASLLYTISAYIIIS